MEYYRFRDLIFCDLKSADFYFRLAIGELFISAILRSDIFCEISAKNWMQNLGSKITFAQFPINPTLLRLSTTFLVFGSEIRKSSFHVVWAGCIAILAVFHEVPFLSTIWSSEVTMQV